MLRTTAKSNISSFPVHERVCFVIISVQYSGRYHHSRKDNEMIKYVLTIRTNPFIDVNFSDLC